MALDCFWRCDACDVQLKAVGPFDPPAGWERRRIQSKIMGPYREGPNQFGQEAKESGCEFILCSECQKKHPPNAIECTRGTWMDAVRDWQLELEWYGLSVGAEGATGLFTAETMLATKAFQVMANSDAERRGLPLIRMDGVLDPDTCRRAVEMRDP